MNRKPGLQQPERPVPDENQLDDALRMTFPASDPMTYQNATCGARSRAAPEEKDHKQGKTGGEAVQSDVPGPGELTPSEKPGGKLDMPRSDRATDLRDEANAERDSNDLGSGVST